MRKINIAIFFLILAFAFQSCHQASTSSFAKAAVSSTSTCTNTITFSVTGSNVFADFFNSNWNIGGESSSGELGVIISALNIQDATVNLGGTNRIYWDPGNDGIDEYGSTSGQIMISSVVFVGPDLQTIELTFDNIAVQNQAGNTICLNLGHIYFKLN